MSTILTGLTVFWALGGFQVRHSVLDRRVELDGQPADVRIVWKRNPILLDLPHGMGIGGGDWRFYVTVTESSGARTRFMTRFRPNGLWRADGALYVSCADGGRWWFGRWRDGVLVQVGRKDLPPNPQPGNLEPPEQRDYWREEFDLWAR